MQTYWVSQLSLVYLFPEQVNHHLNNQIYTCHFTSGIVRHFADVNNLVCTRTQFMLLSK